MKNPIITPISINGILILTAVIAVFSGPGIIQNDLIAFSLATCFFASFLLFGFIALISFLRTKNNFTLSSYFKSKGQEYLYALDDNNLVHELAGLKLLPFCRLRLIITWDSNLIKKSEISVSGSDNKITISDQLRFPYRGVYKVQKAEIIVEDLTHFWAYRSRLNNFSLTAKVLPQLIDGTSIPILNSVFSAGDSLPLGQDRTGDYYDLKQYQAEDGVSKIAWKIYARSGELITRRPEQEVKPEGKIYIYCYAEESDDRVCSELLAYSKKLLAEELEILVGFSGNSTKAINQSDLLNIAIMSAREKKDYSYQDFKNFISDLNSASSVKVLVFIGNEASKKIALQKLMTTAQNLQSEILVITEDTSLNFKLNKPSKFGKFLIDNETTATSEDTSSLVKACLENRVELLTYKKSYN